MKTVLLSSLIGVFFLTSCSTAYKAGQTPDDVYFSPGRTVGDEEYSNNRNREEYQEYTGSQDDAYLRRKVANRNRWSSIDDFSYWNDCRYSFAPLTFNHFNSFYNCFTCPTFNTWGHPFFPLNGGWGFGVLHAIELIITRMAFPILTNRPVLSVIPTGLLEV